MPDGDLFPSDAPNAAYWNHIHRTGQRSDHWELWRGDQRLGRFTPTHLPWTDMFWQGFKFQPEPLFETIRPLFDEELRLLNEEWEINDLGEQHSAVFEEIVALGLTLIDGNGWRLSDFLLHIDNDNNAWFRI